MSISLIAILSLSGAAAVASGIAYLFAQNARQARHERDEFKAQSDRYLKEIAQQSRELERRQKLIDTIQGANDEANERKDQISAGADPAGRFDATLGVLSDIAKSGADTGTKPGAH